MQELIARVAATTMCWNFRMWSFGEAIALRGLLAAGELLEDPALTGFVYGLTRGWVGRGVARSPEDHIAPGRELIAMWRRTGDPVLLGAARDLAALNAGFAVGPHGARCHRPDTPGWRDQIWVDCMDVDGPFLASLAEATGEGRYFDQAAEELLGYARTLQEPEGLFRHGFEARAGRNGARWARGNGWALMGLVDTLILLPREHPAYPELHQILATLVAALAALQRPDGLWHTIVDAPDSYAETTLAAMLAYALPEAVGHGLLGDDTHIVADRALAGVLRHIDADGALGLVSEATPVGEESTYRTRLFGTYPWGQGALLLALTRS